MQKQQSKVSARHTAKIDVGEVSAPNRWQHDIRYLRHGSKHALACLAERHGGGSRMYVQASGVFGFPALRHGGLPQKSQGSWET